MLISGTAESPNLLAMVSASVSISNGAGTLLARSRRLNCRTRTSDHVRATMLPTNQMETSQGFA